MESFLEIRIIGWRYYDGHKICTNRKLAIYHYGSNSHMKPHKTCTNMWVTCKDPIPKRALTSVEILAVNIQYIQHKKRTDLLSFLLLGLHYNLLVVPMGHMSKVGNYRKVSNIIDSKFRNFSDSRPVLQLILAYLLKPCVKSKMKM